MHDTVATSTAAAVQNRPGILASWRRRFSARKRRRLLSSRDRRNLAKSLRLAANSNPNHRRFSVLLTDRAAAVREELRELATVLELADAPDPSWVAEIHALVSDACKSPLYNRDVHVSELLATLYYLRAGNGSGKRAAV